MRSSLPSLAISSILLAPLCVFAAPPNNLQELIGLFTGLLNPLIGLLTGVAVLLFIWGIVKYIISQGNEKQTVTAKNTMFYGVIALFVLFSFWGIVQLLQRSIFG